MPLSAENLTESLHAQRGTFKAFLTERVGSASDAEDILQISLLKAVQHADELQDERKTVPWFYQILRHAVIDHYRSQGAQKRRDEALSTLVSRLEKDTTIPPSWEPQLCSCLGGVIDTLNPQHAKLLRQVDLEGQSVQVAAEQLGLNSNHASVILHRARKALRSRLEIFCGDCAEAGCLDCHCENKSSEM